jgi:hypothetical protein
MIMKKRSLILLPYILTYLVSCGEPATVEEDSGAERFAEMKLESLADEDVEIFTLEGCEYIVYKHHEGANPGYGFMVHKGNCKKPIHCYNKLPDDMNSTVIDTTGTPAGGSEGFGRNYGAASKTPRVKVARYLSVVASLSNFLKTYPIFLKFKPVQPG